MSAKAQHEYAVYLFHRGFHADVVMQLDEVLREEETAERWSDWATAQSALSQFAEAERGFRRALALAPDLAETSVNFGAMLCVLGRWNEAASLLERILPRLEPGGRAAVGALIEQCRGKLAANAPAPAAS